jgi:hypothetical protein
MPYTLAMKFMEELNFMILKNDFETEEEAVMTYYCYSGISLPLNGKKLGTI